MILLIVASLTAMASAGKSWSKGHDQHSNHVDVSGPMATLERLEVVCSRDHMTVHMHFDQPFYGVVFSHGTPRHERCVHVGPRAGVTSMSFDIRYDSCGTVEDRSGQFHENTLVIQFDEDILEAWDQAKRLRCEWLENFEKKSTKPTLAISDLDVVELNFQGDDIDCWMEVQEGKGPWSRQVGGLVPIGSPLTLVISINDHSREFDMRIKRCSASDGKGAEIELTDDRGCVLRPSLLTPFTKVRDHGGKATLVAYSHLFAFKFPDKMDVFVHCIVEVCRHGCPDSCIHHQQSGHYPPQPLSSLESKKIEKLEGFFGGDSKFKHVSGYHHHPSEADYPHPGRERNREEVVVPAAQTQVQTVVSNHSSAEVIKKMVSEGLRATFSPAVFKAALEEKKAKEQQNVEGAASNARGVFVDIENTLHHRPESHPQEAVAPVVHRIIGHDVHWISGDAKEPEGGPPHYQAEPPPKDVSYQAPQPEPAMWSADEVKPLPKPELPSPKDRIPQPEPATWSADEVRPLSKPQAHQHRKPESDAFVSHHYHNNNPYLSKLHWSDSSSKSEENVRAAVLTKQAPQPEPAPWTFEEVNPMHSPEVAKLRLPVATKRPPEPQPEPSTWSLDEVKGFNREQLRILSLNHKMKSSVVPPLYKEVVHPFISTSTTTIPQPVYVSRYNNMSGYAPMMNKMMMMMSTMLPPTYQTAHWPLRTTARHLKPLHRHHYPYPIPQFSPHQQMMMSVIADRRTDQGEKEEDISLYHNLGEEDAGVPRKEDADGMTTTEGQTTAAAPPERLIGIGEVYREDAKNPPESKQSETQEDSLSDAFASVASGKSKVTVIIHKRIPGSEGGKLESGTESSTHPRNPEFRNDPEILKSGSRPSSADQESNVRPTSNSETSVKLNGKPGPQQPENPDLESSARSGYDSGRPAAPLDGGESGGRPAVSGFVPPSLDLAVGADPESKDRAAPVPNPRALDRRKRSSEPVFGVRQKFSAIAPSDLAFEWNQTVEGRPSVLRGRPRQEIIYGICMSPASMSASVGFILILTLLAIIASVVFYEHSCQLSHKTSQLAFFTRNFNGQIEALYKISRPYLYSGGGNVR